MECRPIPRLVRTILLVFTVVVSVLAIGAASAFAVGSGINGLIYYTASNGQTSHIWAMNADGTDQHQVTTDNANNQFSPSVSPNGETVAYSSAIGSNQQIFTQPIVGGATTNISNATGSAVPMSPSYCADGSLVYLEDNAGDGLWDVYRNGIDITNTQWPGSGHAQAEYTENDAQCSLGNSISFTRFTDASFPLPSASHGGTLTPELWSLGATETGIGTERTFYDGAGTQQIRTVEQSAWSPDGNKIAFIGTTNVDNGDQLFTMNADGSSITRIEDTAGEGAPSGISWSPDGSKVAYVRSDHAIEVVTLAGDTDLAVTDVTAYGGLDWAPGPGGVIGVPITPVAPAPLPPAPIVNPVLVSQVGKTPAAATLATLLAAGLHNEVRCNEACTVQSKLFITAALAKKLGLLAAKSKSRVPVLIGTATAKLSAAGSFLLITKLTAKAKKALKKLIRVSLTETVTVTGTNGRSVTKRALTLKAKKRK